MIPRFLFLVHPLLPWQGRVIGLRIQASDLVRGRLDRLRSPHAGRLCRLGIPGMVDGEVVSIPRLPEQLLTDQDDALEQMVRAVEAQDPAPDAVGLGSLLAVVAGRGTALAERVTPPVTTGAAATTWAALGNTLEVLERTRERRVAVLGFGGTVGQALAQALVEAGVEVTVGGKGRKLERQAAKLGVPIADDPEAVRGHRVVVGAATTGGTLEPSALEPDTVLLDVALPPTLKPGPRPPGVRVLAGEAVELPSGLRRGVFGRPYQLIAGYGLRQLYACLTEPMLMAAQGRTEPFAQGRRLSPQAIEAFAEAARRVGLKPRLAWDETR